MSLLNLPLTTSAPTPIAADLPYGLFKHISGYQNPGQSRPVPHWQAASLERVRPAAV